MSTSARNAHELAEQAGLTCSTRRCRAASAAPTAGTLTFMVGGRDAAFAKAKPILEADGQAASSIAAAAARPGRQDLQQHDPRHLDDRASARPSCWPRSSGSSQQELFDVASTASGQCWSLTNYCPVPGPVPASPANRDYQPGFTAAMMLKDLKLAQEAAQGAGASTPIGAHAAELYEQYNAAGIEGADFSGIIQYLRERR